MNVSLPKTLNICCFQLLEDLLLYFIIPDDKTEYLWIWDNENRYGYHDRGVYKALGPICTFTHLGQIRFKKNILTVTEIKKKI